MFTPIVIRMCINNNNNIFILVIQDVWTDGVDHSNICGLLNFWWSSQNRIIILVHLKRSLSSPNFVFVSVFAFFDRDFQERSTASFWLRRDFSLREPEKARCLNSSLWSRSQSSIFGFFVLRFYDFWRVDRYIWSKDHVHCSQPFFQIQRSTPAPSVLVIAGFSMLYLTSRFCCCSRLWWWWWHR